MPDRSVPDLAPLRTGPLVLVVDDDQPDRIAATRMVRGLGYPARSFRQGRTRSSSWSGIRSSGGCCSPISACLSWTVASSWSGCSTPIRPCALRSMADRHDPEAAELLEGYRDLPILQKPLRFADLYKVLTRLAGLPPHVAESSRVHLGRDPVEPAEDIRWVAVVTLNAPLSP